MSGLLNTSLNGSTTSNLQDSTGRPFTPFSAQSATSPAFHHSAGAMQGLHNIHGGFNVLNMSSSLASSRNIGLGGVPSSVVQQPAANLSSGRFASNNLPVAFPQLNLGSSHAQSGVTNRGLSVAGMNGINGSMSGLPPTSASGTNRNVVQGLGLSPILGNASSRIASSMGNLVSGNNIGRVTGSGGGLSVPGLASRLNMAASGGTGSLNVQGPGRLMSGVLQQGPQVISMMGNPYSSSGGLLSQNLTGNNPLSSVGLSNDNLNENSPFDMNDFPQLTGRPSSAGGPQNQLGSMRKQGVNSIVQQSQEFSIQNEDFPALPGFKGGNPDYVMDLHQKEQLHDSSVTMMQPQHFPMGRSAGFTLGGSYVPHRQQQQHAPSVSGPGVPFNPSSSQGLLHLHGSDLFSSHGNYHSQVQSSGQLGIGLRPNMGSYDQLLHYQQQQQNQSQFRLQQVPSSQSYRDENLKSPQGSSVTPDRFGLLGLLSIIKMTNPDLTSLALGIDLTTLGLNLNSTENLYKTFSSPWSDGPARGDPEYSVPECYYAKQPPSLHQGYFARFQTETLFYIFYSMPKDEAQLYAAAELHARGWSYHRELRLWFMRNPNTEPLVKTSSYERGSYICFDPITWESFLKENFVVYYEMLDNRPSIPLS